MGALVIAYPLYLIRGHEQWFFLDDWDFLSARSLSSLHDLLRPHNEHWSTAPIIVYRILWQFVGLRSYVPYQAVIVALHLTVAVMLRRIIRRAGVEPWIATAAAALYLFLGSGREDIVWAFQIGFVGSLACGLGHLLLADHDGPSDRRDTIGIAVGLLGLLCSGVAVTMTVIVGLAVLIRRGWLAAALHTAPLAVIYAAWFLAYGRDAYAHEHSTTVSNIWDFATTGFRNVFSKMGQLPGMGLVLAILLVVGLALAWTRLPLREFRRTAAAPAALLLGAAAFFVVSGYGRSFVGPQAALASRYVHIAAAMLLPALAVAAQAIRARSRYLLPFVLAVFLVGIPGNVDAIVPKGRDRLTLGNSRVMLALPRSPYAAQVPRSEIPNPVSAPYVTMGWLLNGVRSGRIPSPPALTPDDVATVTLDVVLEQTAEHVSGSECSAVKKPLSFHMQRGDVYTFRDGLPEARLVAPDGRVSGIHKFLPLGGSTIHVRAGPVTVLVSRAPLTRRLIFCRRG